MGMLHGEGFLICNGLLCGCALPLGGKLAGLSMPGLKRLAWASLLAGLLAVPGIFYPLAGMISLPLCVWLAFGENGRAACLRCTLTTLGASVLSGGAALTLTAHGVGIPAALGWSIGFEWLIYLLVQLLPSVLRQVRQVELTVGERSILLPAMLDSGNLMRDPVTALPVLVIPLKAAYALHPDAGRIDALRALPKGFRLLHVRTAAGSALLPMFRPDRCRLYVDGVRQDANLLAAVAGPEYRGAQALVPLAAVRE